MNSLMKLFPNEAIVKVLTMFLSHPDETYYQASVVKESGFALIQVQRALKRLLESGIIEKARSGNRIYYKANQGHPAFHDLKNAFLKTIICDDVLKKSLKSVKRKIHFAFVYGSMASGKEKINSDIDLLLVGDLGIKDIADAITDASRFLEREINPTIYSEKEIVKKIKDKNPFVNELVTQPKIWLFGDDNEFRKMAKGR